MEQASAPNNRQKGSSPSVTIIVSVNTLSEILLLADTRLSGMGNGGKIVVRQDVCQKLIVPNNWSVVGFAGQLCLARHVLRGFGNRLRATSQDSPDWLRDDIEVLRFFKSSVKSHGKMRSGKGTDHRECERSKVEILISWIDIGRDFSGKQRSSADSKYPPRLETIVLSSPPFQIERYSAGVQVIGSGSVISEELRKEAFTKIAWYAKGIPYEEVHRAFFTAVVTRDLLDDAADPMVGDAYQLAYLSHTGVHVIPYFYWSAVDKQNGTYVAMRIEGGEWIQEHRPSGKKIRIMSPFEFQLRHPDWTSAKSKLIDTTSISQGVIPDHNGRLTYHLYDPENVPETIVRSWGSEPLARISWAEENTKPDKRYRP